MSALRLARAVILKIAFSPFLHERQTSKSDVMLCNKISLIFT